MKHTLAIWTLLLALLLSSCGQSQQQNAPDDVQQTTEQTEFSFEGTTFHYGEHDYDLTLRSPSITSILSAVLVGDKIVIEGHCGPKNGVYCIFDTVSESFETDLWGHHLIWHSDDITTAIYAFWSDIYTYDGSIIKKYDLAENEFIYNLEYTENYTKLKVTIVCDDDTQQIDTLDLTNRDVLIASLYLDTLEPYQPWLSLEEPDTVPADTMGDILCEKALPDGTEIVCYWQPDTEFTKYWAVRQGDSLLRFCKEDDGYNFDYDVDTFSDVLGHDGFRIMCPRGAAYYAHDYYYMDENGVPQVLAHCSNHVLEQDLDGDGQKELLWFGGGAIPLASYVFQREGVVYEADISIWLEETLRRDFPLVVVPYEPGWAEQDYSMTLFTGGADANRYRLGEGFLRFKGDSIQFFLPSDLADLF